MRRPRTFVDDASEFLATGVSNAFSFLSGATVPTSPKATPDEVFNGDIDLHEGEVKYSISKKYTPTDLYCRSLNKTGEKKER